MWPRPLRPEEGERGIEIGERMLAVADALDADAVLLVPALVTEDVPVGATVAGVPAEPISRES